MPCCLHTGYGCFHPAIASWVVSTDMSWLTSLKYLLPGPLQKKFVRPLFQNDKKETNFQAVHENTAFKTGYYILLYVFWYISMHTCTHLFKHTSVHICVGQSRHMSTCLLLWPWGGSGCPWWVTCYPKPMLFYSASVQPGFVGEHWR